METRQQYSNEDIHKRRSQRSKSEDDQKPVQVTSPGKTGNCKHKPSQPLLLAVMLATLIFITYSLTYHNHHNNYIPHVVSKWKWGGGTDQRYMSHLEIKWDDISHAINKLSSKNQMIHGNIGFLNFKETEINSWKTKITQTNENQIVVLHLDPVDKNVTWDSLYPEWIDEEQEDEVPSCPNLPKLEVPRKRIDMIVVKLPCENEGNCWRDVGRLHLQLAAAGLAPSSGVKHLVFIVNQSGFP